MKIPLIITSILFILGITTSSEASFATVLESKEKKQINIKHFVQRVEYLMAALSFSKIMNLIAFLSMVQVN